MRACLLVEVSLEKEERERVEILGDDIQDAVKNVVQVLAVMAHGSSGIRFRVKGLGFRV